MAQTGSSVAQQGYSTGMVGVTSTESVQLNVLNLGPQACTVQMGFYNQNNALVGSLSAKQTVGVGDAVQYSEKIPISNTVSPLRTEVRGLVTTTPIVTPTATGAPSQPTSVCTLFITLEVYENTGGAATVFTSDVRAVPSVTATPVTVK